MKRQLYRFAHRLILIGTCALAAIIWMQGCRNPLLNVVQEEVAAAVTLPEVSAIFPADSSRDVSPNSELSITFTKNINQSTVNAATLLILDPDEASVGGKYTVQDATVTFTPTGGFQFGKVYTVRISTQVQDTDGKALAEEYVWTFTTSLTVDVTVPELRSLSFAAEAISVIDEVNWSASALISVTVDASDDRGIAQIQFSENPAFTNAIWTTWNTETTQYELTLSAGDGLKKLYAQIKDGAGNLSSVAVSPDIWLDLTAPEINDFLLNDGASATNNSTVNLALFARDSEISSGLKAYRYAVNGGQWTEWLDFDAVELEVGQATVNNLDLLTELGSTATILAEVLDNVSNISSAFESSILFEQTPPTVVDVSWDNQAIFPYNGTVLRIQFDEEMNPGSFSETLFTVEALSGGGPLPAMVSLLTVGDIRNNAAELWGLELAPNTSYKVQLQESVTDIAGNGLGEAKYWFFSTGDAVDSTPPEGVVNLTDQGATVDVVILPTGSTATSSATVQLDFSQIADDYNIPYGIKIWGDNDGLHQPDEESFEQDAAWRSWTNTIDWHVSTSSGTKYILYKLMDSAGNESPTPNQIKVILDNAQVPVIYSVQIDSGAAYTNSSNREVLINIAAEDIHSGIKEIMIANDAAFTNAQWQPWQPVIEDWVLPDSNELHRFYIKVRDYLDQESVTSSTATITLDRVAPVITFIIPQILVNTDTKILSGITYTATDNFSIASYNWQSLGGSGELYFNDSDSGGNTNTGTTLAQPWIHATVEGEYFFQLTVTDNAGNTSSTSIPLTWDTTPPGTITDLVVPQYNTNGQPSWTWSGTSTADFYRTSYSSDFSSPTDVAGTSFSPPAPLTPDGSKTLYVRAYDNAGNYSNTLSASVHVDTTPPTISITNMNYVANAANQTITINFSGTDGSALDSGTNPSGLASWLWTESSGTGNVSFGSSTANTTTVSASADGDYQLRLRVMDTAGNQSYANLMFLRDITLPGTPTVSGPSLTPNLQPTWYWASNGGGTGTFEIKLANTTNSTTVLDWTETTTTSYKPPSLLTDQKTYTLSVREIDAAGNWSSAGTFTTEVDSSQTTPPEITIGDAYPALRNVNSITWDILSGSGGIASQYRYYFDGSGTWTTVTSPLSTPTEISRSSLADGTHSITVQEYFNAAWQTTATHTIVVDTTAPSAPVLSGSGLATTLSGRNAYAALRPNWTWSGGGGGNGRFQYKVTRLKHENGTADGTIVVNWTADTTATNYTPSVNFTNATYQLEVKERDDAGNYSAASTLLITVDTAYPTLTSVVLRGPTNPNDTDYTYTNSATVSIDISGDISSELNTAYTRTVKINIYNGNPSAWVDHATNFPTATPTAATVSTTLTTTNGTKTVYLRLRDEAGNTTSYVYDSILLDNVAPTGSFSINGGAATTPSSSFNMNLTASDTYSQASDIEVAMANPATGVWGDYRPYATSMISDSELPKFAGSHSTSVRFRDGAGNVSGNYGDGIYLEVPVPQHAIKGLYSGGYTYVYFAPVTDPAGGTYTTRYYVYSTTTANANPNNGDPVTYRYNTTATSSIYAPIPKGEIHYFFLRAYDADTGGYGPYSSASVMGFSSNVTIIYDDDEPADVTRAEAMRDILIDTQNITANTNIIGTMPVWSVTLLPEDLISNVSAAENTIYGDPIIATSGTSFTTTTTWDGRVRNIAAGGKGLIAMGYGGGSLLYRIDQNWSTWLLTGTKPGDIDSGNQMTLNPIRTAKTRPTADSESIWYTPLYYTVLYNSYQNSSISVNIYSVDTARRGVSIPSMANPPDGAIYAGDDYSTSYFPVVRQGRFLTFGYAEVPTLNVTGHVFFINLVARMDNY